MVGVVWVIEFYEVAEAGFDVGGPAGMREDLVRCR